MNAPFPLGLIGRSLVLMVVIGVAYVLAGVVLLNNASGGEDRVVASLPREVRAEWTPDGRDIAIVQGQGVSTGLMLVAPDGSSRRTIWSKGGAPEASVSTMDFGTLRF